MVLTLKKKHKHIIFILNIPKKSGSGAKNSGIFFRILTHSITLQNLSFSVILHTRTLLYFNVYSVKLNLKEVFILTSEALAEVGTGKISNSKI